ncbi:Acetyl-/propionyl-coenzyme A carboxylase alpha chain [Variovorax sp. PBL-H6]|uniref:acetyl/propionyl/methylcrotonyl-CoA carboxylase subunit alpha n=1 Tax=Variovorax sp. PBL-H6 TaxID=434009 RepID=UPI0013177873|nr:acetyl-CoA carboxylase biotin carboxylase subunit [Variovorax sp. PBL-H6]VTU24802.1 Acetyl-/propionyl-coenzyme A carboxylase alpha chain [Variovorax sp. PBL-H6]
MKNPTPFDKVLIANRGEIALRVMRSARLLGYRTVAVYSTADAQAAHVAAADQAVCIGEPLPAQSYLRIPAIIDAARASGADAIHPGYGFLAENEDFAAACREAGLVFIGPSPEAIRAMGDKAGAKRLMIEAGVPCIPGYQGDDQGEQRLSEEAARIGYPVMIKATAGGGGRGMRLVKSAGEFKDLLRSAQSEAKNAFGDATVILERAIIEPRHIEIQVFADRFGNAVHLGERDCSVQRRHQKVIEEAPSPAVNAELRARMGATAVAAVKAIGYEGAGTLEFLLDREGHYYFMEMNTRLQVEHPVTEAITGLDLVEWQLRVAAGEALPLAQDAITFSGHAIEVRLCAEDVPAGFMPQSGTLRRWQVPKGLRVEHGLRSGASIPPFYDSMIAKLIAHGATRDEARRRLLRGVEDTVALGVRTNQEFLARCLAHRVFADGAATTAFIAQNEADLIGADDEANARAALIGAWLLHETAGLGRHATGGRSLAHSLPLGMRFSLDGVEQVVSVSQTQPHTFRVTAGGREHVLQSVSQGEQEARFILDGVMDTVAFDRDGSSLWLRQAGRPHVLEDRTRAATARAEEGGGDGRVRASMNGRVVAIFAAVGDKVAPGQPLLTLEAMKMEHVHSSSVHGVVTAVLVGAGEQVEARRVVVEVQPEPRKELPNER